MLSVRSLKRARLALYISIPLILVFKFFCVWDGIVIYSMFHDCDPILRPENTVIKSSDQLLPYALLTLFESYPGMTGLCIAGVFSAALSTVSSALNSLTAVTMEDFIRPYCFCKKLNEYWEAFLVKFIAIVFGVICSLLTIIVAQFRGVLEATVIFFGMVAAPVFGVFSLGVLTTTANQSGTLIGLFAGVTLSAWIGIGSYITKAKIPQLLRSIEGCAEVVASIKNGTLSDQIELVIENENFEEENKDIFPLYKMSYLWNQVFGTLTVLVVGYLSSFIIGCIQGRQQVNAECITPVLRKWYFKTNEYIPENSIELSEEATFLGKTKSLSTRQKKRNIEKAHHVES